MHLNYFYNHFNYFIYLIELKIIFINNFLLSTVFVTSIFSLDWFNPYRY